LLLHYLENVTTYTSSQKQFNHCCYKAGNSGDISYYLLRCCFTAS